MDEITFEKYRKDFRHSLVEKSIGQIRAKKHELEMLQKMYPYQIGYLIYDLKIMEIGKTKLTNPDANWEKIVEQLSE